MEFLELVKNDTLVRLAGIKARFSMVNKQGTS
jgi:hypothetical protein